MGFGKRGEGRGKREEGGGGNVKLYVLTLMRISVATEMFDPGAASRFATATLSPQCACLDEEAVQSPVDSPRGSSHLFN